MLNCIYIFKLIYSVEILTLKNISQYVLYFTLVSPNVTLALWICKKSLSSTKHKR